MAKQKQKYNTRVSPEDFIKAWQTSSTTEGVTEKTGLKMQAAATRACLYRKKGIPLRYMRQGTPKLDIETLTKLAIEYGEE